TSTSEQLRIIRLRNIETESASAYSAPLAANSARTAARTRRRPPPRRSGSARAPLLYRSVFSTLRRSGPALPPALSAGSPATLAASTAASLASAPYVRSYADSLALERRGAGSSSGSANSGRGASSSGAERALAGDSRRQRRSPAAASNAHGSTPPVGCR
ncbi:uncharacterized protein, partial [Epargyreus clarus]|uniref:uncharacterized protein n=1 Tax=Epargyreus clarus TaxID=520877 RepID=UPI003C30B03D